MKRLARILFIIAAAMLVLNTAGGWAVNRWLQSAQSRAFVEGKLADALALPVKYEKIRFSVWSGLTAEGIAMPAQDGNFLEAAAISVKQDFASLLRGNLVLAEVRIERPRLRVTETDKGMWRFPKFSRETPKPPITHPVPVAASAPPKPKEHTSARIRKLVISGGTVDLIDSRGAPFADLTGLNATLTDVTDRSFSGKIESARTTLHGYAAIDRLRTDVTYKDKAFDFRNALADAGGGHITGEFSYTEGAPSTTRVVLDGVRIEQVTAQVGTLLPNMAGAISGEARITGLGGGAKAATGKGTLTLGDGRCPQIDLVRQIGDVLQLESISNFQIAEARADFQIASERVFLKPLHVSAPPLGISLSGSAGFDSTLDLAAVLTAPADFIAKRGLVAGQFTPPDQNQRRGVGFDIKGTLSKPKHNLVERVTGTKDKTVQKIMAVEAIISALAGKKDKHKSVEPKPSVPPNPAQP